MKPHNFYAGPAILPKPVFQEAADAVLNFNGTGLSILEISHRSKEFTAVMEESQQLVKDLLNIPDTHEVLFLTGGASSQFYMTCMNILGSDQKAAYVDTGTWSTKAIKEAKNFGQIEVIASSKDQNYNYIPEIHGDCAEYRFTHITTNNTIFGTQYQNIPSLACPLVADMSSDIFSRPLNIDKYDIIYAGAQKNLGPAGVTLVILRKDILGKVERNIPTMLNYQTHIDKGSSFNTPPVFPIYVSLLSLRWLKSIGGVAEIENINSAKAGKLYQTIDDSKLFFAPVRNEDRSKMNVVFKIRNEELQDDFLRFSTESDCIGIKGHRSVGGFRASIYNAMEMDGINKLCDVINDFDQKHG